MVRPLFFLAPVLVSAAVAWPMSASRADASVTPSRPADLQAALDAELERVVPGAEVNGLDVVSFDQRRLGIGEWSQVTGTARTGRGAMAVEYRFSGRYDPQSERVAGLRVRAVPRASVALAEEGRKVVEAAVERQLDAEFPEQSPRFTLVSASRVPDVGSGERVFQGRGLIDFGDQGEVLAPIEVRFDAEARITSLRYSLDELDPAPFDDATSEPATDVDAMIATR